MNKFQKIDKLYFRRRKLLSEKYGRREMWSLMDHWPLYCGIANLGRFMVISDLLRSTLNVPGHIAEFGTWRGANAVFLAKLLHIYDPHSLKLVHCFDSFRGLTNFSSKDSIGVKAKGKYKGNLDELKDMIALYDLGDKMKIHKGLIEQTLPRALRSNKALAFSLIYCDTDLYESTRCILEHCHPRLVKGGLFVLDEWNHENYPGEGVAVSEFLKDNSGYYKVEHNQYARQPTLTLRRLK